MGRDPAIGTELLAAQEREARLAGAQAVAKMGSWEWDIARNVVTWSDELYRLHGLRPGEDLMKYEYATLLVHPDDRLHVQQAVARSMQTHEPLSIEYRVVHPNGVVRRLHGRAEVTLDAGGQPAKMTGTAADITELVTERVLAGARADFRALLDDLPIGIVVNRGVRWIYVNRAFAAALARPIEELVGHSPLEFLHPDEHADVTARIRETASAGPTWEPRERRYLRPDGREVVIEVSPSLLADFEGEPGILLKMRNMTEHRRLLAQQLLSERLVSLGTLAAGVAHEINNPLTYVTSNLDMIAEEMRILCGASASGPMREIETMATEAREGAERVRMIVRGLKLLSRVQDEPCRPLDLHHVIEVSINMAKNEIRHRACLERQFGDLPLVMGDEARLGQVFVNLLINAAQAIPVGDIESNEIRVVTRTDREGQAVVELRDTGPGIRPEVLPRVFDPFFTTKEVGVGTGLGLSVCHGIVTALGGRIEIDTEVGKGTCFRVTLPAAPPDSVAHPESQVYSSRSPSRRARILVVDDEPMVRQTLCRALREHDVTPAENGKAALEILRADRSFDVILCDLMMPEVTGMDVHREIARLWPDLVERMIFVTGGAFTPSARAFLGDVPNQRLEKPFDVRILRALVDGQLRIGRPSEPAS